MVMSRWRAIVVVLTALIAMPIAARAQDYPTRNVTILVPFAPAGGIDVLARAHAHILENKYGKSLVIENRPDGGTTLAAGRQIAADRPHRNSRGGRCREDLPGAFEPIAITSAALLRPDIRLRRSKYLLRRDVVEVTGVDQSREITIVGYQFSLSASRKTVRGPAFQSPHFTAQRAPQRVTMAPLQCDAYGQ
jgi:hypothetical protein